MNPMIEGDSNGSSMNQSIKKYDSQQSNDMRDLDLALGKIPGYNQTAGGRTINIPKYLPEGVVPGASFNNANTIGEQCIGSHCGISIKPTAFDYMNNISSLPNSPIGVQSQVPGGPRLGNSSYTNQVGGSLFQEIFDPISLKKYRINSSKGMYILRNYLDKIINN